MLTDFFLLVIFLIIETEKKSTTRGIYRNRHSSSVKKARLKQLELSSRNPHLVGQ